MSTHLDRILSHTLQAALARKESTDLRALELQAAAHTPRGFAAALTSCRGPAVIAELKKASPSKGVLREDYRPAETAKTFQAAGAACLSVLTNAEFFQGSLADLAAVSAAVSIPVLCKDFMVDPFQILEARAAGADAILLIVAAHDDAVLRELAAVAREQGLDILCEVHDAAELERASILAADFQGADMIGVNCRDLRTLDVHTQVHFDLAGSLPKDVVRVAESGIRDVADVHRLQGAGYNAFLIGEALMRHPNPAAALALMTGSVYHPGL